ncbi:hypothetical protein ACFFKH_07110 [Micromonospora marina]|uniref:Uncharacterized protein n=1 Tax=Micromonospora marina TaxID=307120 RepID=A0A1C4VYU2_9ACTN|nr:hypothetical protein [Micromonospora marina]SCE89015.1 hypothetical protein GA0070215_104100 [Micromonospora marina]
MTSVVRLNHWAQVDPAPHPYDPAAAVDVVRRLAPPVPPAAPAFPSLRPCDPIAWDAYRWACQQSLEWNTAMADALVREYGPWASGWGMGPHVTWDRWAPVVTSPEETLVLVAQELTRWRRCLEGTADRFGRLLPSLRAAAGPDDTVAAWEAAITELLTATVAWVEDDDGWQGWCDRVLTWLLTAAGLPEERSATLVNRALGTRFYGRVRLSAADVADIAEHLARNVVGPRYGAFAGPGQGGDDWPDTWPEGWPSWRATNRARPHS